MLSTSIPMLKQSVSVHVVLSTLYQKKMVTKQEVDVFIAAVSPWHRLLLIQCTKPPDVVKRTVDLLAEIDRNVERNHLKGQECIVSDCCLSVVICCICSEQKKWRRV